VRVEPHLAQIGLDPHDPRDGSGIAVAILDGGIDLGHPDLAGRVDAEDLRCFAGGDAHDRSGHGTGMAGLIGARATVTRYGVAPGCRLIVGKIFPDHGSGAEEQALFEGLAWAADRGAQVICVGAGRVREEPGFSADLEEVAAELLASGVLVFAPTGNGSQRPHRVELVRDPAACPSVMGVAAVARDGRVHPCSAGGLGVDLAAPGEDVLSAGIDGKRHTRGGTSPAAAIAAGAAAVLWSGRPGATAAEIRAALLTRAVRAGAPAEVGAGIVSLSVRVPGVR
jgi:subtilisin family serine protease